MGGGRISSDLSGKCPAPLKVMTAWASGSPTQTPQLQSGNTRPSLKDTARRRIRYNGSSLISTELGKQIHGPTECNLTQKQPGKTSALDESEVWETLRQPGNCSVE